MPAPEVVILPNNKNIIAVAEQVDALTDKTVRVLPDPLDHRGLRRAHRLRPRGLRRRERRRPWASWPPPSCTARSPRPCATRSATPARSPRATGSGISRDGHRGRRARPRRRLHRPARRPASTDHELVTVIEGEGASAGMHPARSPSGSPSTTPTSRPRSTTAASRSTRTCSGSSSRRPTRDICHATA